jgi:3-oxoacyl-(acyl-carrier-protein) synthase
MQRFNLEKELIESQNLLQQLNVNLEEKVIERTIELKSKNQDLKKEVGRKDRKAMPEQAMYAFVSTKEALENAGMSQDFIDENEVGILFGNDSTAGAVIEGVDLLRAKKDTTLIGSGNIFQSMNSTVTMNLSTIFKLKGVNFTISAACASGSHSIGMGYLHQNGLAKTSCLWRCSGNKPIRFREF